MKRSADFISAMQASDEGRHADAVRLMEQCAKGGDPAACYFMALWCRDGEGVPASDVQKQHWMDELERLAEAGHSQAQWELGQCLRFGNVFSHEIRRANHWLERAAESGWAEAQHQLAWYSETGQYGYEANPQAAEEWYRRAFDQGHPETLYMFALREFDNDKLTEKAVALLTQAANSGFQQANHVLRERTH